MTPGERARADHRRPPRPVPWEHNGYHTAVTQAQATRKRLTDAAQWLITRAVNGSGLTVRAGEAEALITKPGRRDSTVVRICYAGGAVYRNGTYLGILDGYEPSDGQRIGQAEILAALNSGTPNASLTMTAPQPCVKDR